jgi:hypothetical protein
MATPYATPVWTPTPVPTTAVQQPKRRLPNVAIAPAGGGSDG